MSGNARGIPRMTQYERRVLTRQYCTFFALSRALSQSPGSRLIEQNVTCTSIGSRGQQPLCFDSVLFPTFGAYYLSNSWSNLRPFYKVWKSALDKSNDSFRNAKQMSIIDHRRFENKSLTLIYSQSNIVVHGKLWTLGLQINTETLNIDFLPRAN